MVHLGINTEKKTHCISCCNRLLHGIRNNFAMLKTWAITFPTKNSILENEVQRLWMIMAFEVFFYLPFHSSLWSTCVTLFFPTQFSAPTNIALYSHIFLLLISKFHIECLKCCGHFQYFIVAFSQFNSNVHLILNLYFIGCYGAHKQKMFNYNKHQRQYYSRMCYTHIF